MTDQSSLHSSPTDSSNQLDNSTAAVSPVFFPAANEIPVVVRENNVLRPPFNLIPSTNTAMGDTPIRIPRRSNPFLSRIRHEETVPVVRRYAAEETEYMDPLLYGFQPLNQGDSVNVLAMYPPPPDAEDEVRIFLDGLFFPVFRDPNRPRRF